MEVCFYDIGAVDDAQLDYAVIVSRYQGRWVWVKNSKRKAWEVPGGHREENEAIIDTAKRELYEETGALRFDLTPICVYSVKRDSESFGMLFYAEIAELGDLPNMEIERVEFFDSPPENLSFPLIQPHLVRRVEEGILLIEDAIISKWSADVCG